MGAPAETAFGALLAAAIAAKELFKLGPLWPSPIVVLIVATLMLLWALYGGPRPRDRRDDHQQPQPTRVGVSVGVRADKFYEKYAEGSPLEARERLLDDLVVSFDKNHKRITRKRRWLRTATLFLVAGLGVAGSMILLDRPTKMGVWPKKSQSHQNSSVRCLGLQGSNRSGPAARRYKASGGGELIEIAEEIESSKRGLLVELAEELECG